MKIHSVIKENPNNSRFYVKLPWFFCLLLLFVSAPAQSALHETTQGEPRPLTEQESWILGQIRQGKEADLKKRFPGNKEKCALGAGFLEQLLTVGFPNTQISRHGVKIANATITGDLNLENVEIGYPVSLTSCIFKGRVTFQKSCFKKDLSFQGSEFLQNANFKGIKIDGSAILNDAHFEEESLWCDAKIGEQLQADRAEFRSSTGTADFNSIKVGDCAFFNSATFHGPVIFVVAVIGKQFLADEAKFLNPEELANFGGIKLERTIFFRKAEFHGPVMFEFAEFGINFRAAGAKFLNERQAKNFSKMKVGQKLDMDGTLIRGAFDLSYGDFFDLVINGKLKDENAYSKANVPISHLKLKGAVVQRDLKITNLDINDLDASHMQVKGHAIFKDTQITQLADFRNGNFQALDFKDIKWPEVALAEELKEGKKPYHYKVYLGELTYSSLSINKPESASEAKTGNFDYSEDDFKTITGFLDACPFYTQSYVQLETFFKRIGRDAFANRVFMRMNNRELAEKMSWYDPRRWLEWFFWGKIAGYGRAPFRVFFLALAFILLGAFLFDPRYLKENKRETEGRIYKLMIVRFFISLDRFLPIELGLASHWDCRSARFLIWFYFHLQQILGWILLPIALASIYSQLK